MITADDLFAGAGGWDLAAARLGVHARGVENMPQARATRDAAGLTTIHDDVWTFEPDGKASGLIASPPCQTFSAAGKGSGREALDDVLRGIRDNYVGELDHLRFLGAEVGDDRTALVLTPLHFALTGTYEWLAWEQVPAVLPVWEACADALRDEGWSAWTGLLQAEQYGVPQTRKRAFLLASRTGSVAPPVPTHSRFHSRDPRRLDPIVAPWVSMAEALGWGLSERPSPTVTGGGTETGGAEPIAKLARYTDRTDWLFRVNAQARATVRSAMQPAPTLTVGHASAEMTWQPAVMAGAGTSCTLTDPRLVTEPAHTITGAATAEWGDRATRAPGPGQRDPQGRRVTVAEAGVLQSFPADYPWQGAIGKQYLQCGNAVPPGLARAALSVVVPQAAEVAA